MHSIAYSSSSSRNRNLMIGAVCAVVLFLLVLSQNSLGDGTLSGGGYGGSSKGLSTSQEQLINNLVKSEVEVRYTKQGTFPPPSAPQDA